MQLSRDSIIAASLTILGRFGLADMTMRRVAASLGVAPGALYWHFKNKQALIDATARTLLADFLTSRYDDFPTACRALRDAMLATRDGAELINFDCKYWLVELNSAYTPLFIVCGSEEYGFPAKMYSSSFLKKVL